MNKICEPKTSWGGVWTEQKLATFEAYVSSYLKIMYSTREKHNGWPREIIYFDGFAGSGQRVVEKNSGQEKLFPEYFESNENEVYKGSAERVLRLNKKFDGYYFIDLDQIALTELESLLTSKNLCLQNCKFLCGDANNFVIQLANYLDNQKTALVLLDPFGMQIQWNSIESMKNKRIDLWILIPSEVIINRFIDRAGRLQFSENLESFFGLPKNEIESYFYKKSIVYTLFGNIEEQIKVSDSINKIAQLYVEKLKSIFQYVTKKPLELRNSKNVTIFHFVFASNNKTAYNIANQIIEKKQK